LMPGVTYWYSPSGRYGGQRISHMVSLVHADDKHFVVLDNNYIGERSFEWLSPEEARKTFTGGRGQYWAIIPLTPGQPPAPWNTTQPEVEPMGPVLALLSLLSPPALAAGPAAKTCPCSPLCTCGCNR